MSLPDFHLSKWFHRHQKGSDMATDNPTPNAVTVPKALTGNPAIDFAPDVVAAPPVPVPAAAPVLTAQAPTPVPAASDVQEAAPAAPVPVEAASVAPVAADPAAAAAPVPVAPVVVPDAATPAAPVDPTPPAVTTASAPTPPSTTAETAPSDSPSVGDIALSDVADGVVFVHRALTEVVRTVQTMADRVKALEEAPAVKAAEGVVSEVDPTLLQQLIDQAARHEKEIARVVPIVEGIARVFGVELP